MINVAICLKASRASDWLTAGMEPLIGQQLNNKCACASPSGCNKSKKCLIYRAVSLLTSTLFSLGHLKKNLY